MDIDLNKENCSVNINLFRWLFFMIISIFFINSSLAQGDLVIFPKRVVFDGKKKVKQLNLANIGKDSAVYNISFIEYRMNEFGEFEAITEPDPEQHFATPNLRVYPRKVTLAPNESQTIKIQVTNSNNLEDGEYRSHLYFRAEKNNTPLGQENRTNDSLAISIKLKMVYGISIATIINKGISNTVTSISGLTYEKDINSGGFLNFEINRTGNMSVYGDITINYISSENNLYEVGKARGLAVYAPGTIRKIKMQLQNPEGVNFNNGKYVVIYTLNKTKKVIAEAELEI